MKIFISHSSKNDNYGQALVDLLTGVGISAGRIIYTSNVAHGIPRGQNIFNWLKDRINEKPYVIYLLSPEYYSSIACLNEMGAAWVVENEHAIAFTPNFKLDTYEFQNGALDPREIGFHLNDLDRLTEFIESLRLQFSTHPNPVLINQKIREFLKKIEPFQVKVEKSDSTTNLMEFLSSSVDKAIDSLKTTNDSKMPIQPVVQISDKIRRDNVDRFFIDLKNDKLKDEVVLLLHYIMDTFKYKLGTGYNESNEIQDIKVWEEFQELNNSLSRNYQTVLRMLEMRKLTKVTEVTSYDNPKEVSPIEEMQEILLDIPADISKKILEIVAKNLKDDKEVGEKNHKDDFPF